MASGGKSSRIIVKNLPKSIADDRIREHFAQKGEITDVQLKFTQYVGVVGARPLIILASILHLL